jgi:hypothetical protein
LSTGAARRLAWSLWAIAVAVIACGTVFAILNGGTGASSSSTLDYALTVPLLVMPTIGALVAARHPRNPVGWILLGDAVLVTVAAFAESWATYALFTHPGALPGGGEAAAIASSIFIPALVLMPVLLFLLFPDGRLPGRRWRWVVVLAAVATTGAALSAGIFVETLDDAPFEGVPNDLHVRVPDALASLSAWIGWPGIALSIAFSAAGMIMRLRRSRGLERQQLKWMAAAAALFAVIVVLTVISYFVGLGDVGGVALIVAYASVPVAAGAAILRHRLYDIDLVINRALVYGALTALLAGTYVGLALLLSLALEPITSGSDLAIALSTLGVAALVRPVRRRLQGVVDRRFYRRKYDAARTLERFAASLRSQTDLDTLRTEMTTVVHETMQPAHVSLWLRGPRP